MTAPEEKPAKAQALPEPSALLRAVIARLGALVVEHRSFRGDERIHVARANIVAAARMLRDSPELAFDMLLDITAIDYFGQPDDFRNAPEVWDRRQNLIRRRGEWRHRVNLPARGGEPRFAVVYHFVSTRHLHRIRVKCRVPDDDPTIATLSELWPGANWLERETFDLYGIRFSGHPDLRRIYLYDEFVGHPLRKDYAKHDEQPIQPYAGPGANQPRRPH
ncbi:MAG TPA: NADH-quinone oxidoreductase subunit C [Candidatus Binataceae bacterium]|nr:NADH-quinone oxidoreductase subunit C [Candidatus Binataceae bacterium]